MKTKESGDPFTDAEAAKMVHHPDDTWLPYDNASPELRLYRKFVREFIGSSKLVRAQRTGAEWHVDKKLKHVWKRYCGDQAYKHMSDAEKRGVMGKALWDAVGIHHPLESVEQDYAKRESAKLSSTFNPSLADKVALGLGEALANKASLGIYGLVKIGNHLRDGARRQEIAETYARRFGGTGTGSDDLDMNSIRSLDDDGALGVAASFLALKLERFTRRQTTLLAAQSLAVAGNAFSVVPGLGQGLSVASTVVSGAVTAEQAFRNLSKRITGNLGVARETMAVSLWGLGNRCHGPSLQFLQELGILDEDGYLRYAGFFDRNNMRVASNFIASELKSTGKS
jgi:hypothetical protein